MSMMELGAESLVSEESADTKWVGNMANSGWDKSSSACCQQHQIDIGLSPIVQLICILLFLASNLARTIENHLMRFQGYM